MANSAETLFSAAEQEAISVAIKAAEAKTAGEIAVMVVDRSDTYPEGIILGGVMIGSLLALALTDLLGYHSQWAYVPSAALGAFLAGAVLKLLPFLHRLFVPAGRLGALVRRRAEQAFYEKGLHLTRDASGVLFFLSCFERKVWVLADSGIYAKITSEDLQSYADRVVQGLRGGRQAQALCDEIARLGEVLACHFPIRSGDTNELSDQVIIESRRP
jgi:putative membrane protein